ncbi:MAG: hypothetical protein V4555_11590 [Acidobacteriota bacterium]
MSMIVAAPWREIDHTFLWPGLQWSTTILLSRAAWLVAAFSLTLLAALFFDRFDPARELPLQFRRKKSQPIENPITLDGPAVIDSPTSPTDFEGPPQNFEHPHSERSEEPLYSARSGTKPAAYLNLSHHPNTPASSLSSRPSSASSSAASAGGGISSPPASSSARSSPPSKSHKTSFS